MATIDDATMRALRAIIQQELSNATSVQAAAQAIAKGVTQYIGARYVPLFAEPLQWDNTREYEPLTIVLYQGNSYTTRQYTPAGIEITNEAFWAETGNYNAQIEQYRQEVLKFDGRISSLENAENENKKAINDNKQATGSTMLQRKNKKYIIIGDSYSVREGGNWVDYFVNDFNLTKNVDYFFNGKSSTGFRGDPNITDRDVTFLNLLNELDSTITDKESITDIIVLGGTNDTYTPMEPSKILEAINDFSLAAKNKYPNAIVHIGYNGYTNDVTLLKNRGAIIRVYKERCIGNSVYVTGIENSWHYAAYLADNVHPTANAMQLIATALENHLNGGNVEMIAQPIDTSFTATGDFTGSTVNVLSFFNGDVCGITIEDITIIPTTPFTLQMGETWTEIGTLATNSWIVGSGFYVSIANVKIWDGSIWNHYMLPIKIEGLKIYIMFNYRTTAVFSTINVQQIKISGVNYIVSSVSN